MPGETHGVIPFEFTAKEPIELWAACNKDETKAYEFGCNHILLGKGEMETLPVNPIAKYDAEGPHVHLRIRTDGTPHNPNTSDWTSVPLKTCSCDDDPAERSHVLDKEMESNPMVLDDDDKNEMGAALDNGDGTDDEN